MAKKKRKKQGSKEERLFRKILTDRAARIPTVKKNFEWFFPIYFYKRLEYPTAPFQAEMIRLR